MNIQRPLSAQWIWLSHFMEGAMNWQEVFQSTQCHQLDIPGFQLEGPKWWHTPDKQLCRLLERSSGLASSCLIESLCPHLAVVFPITGKLSTLRWPDSSQADSVSLWVNLCPSLDDRGIALAKGSGQGSILWGLTWSHRVSLSQTSFPMKPAPCSGFLSSFPSGIYAITFSTTGINVFFKGFFASLASQYFKVYTIWAGETPQLEKMLALQIWAHMFNAQTWDS